MLPLVVEIVLARILRLPEREVVAGGVGVAHAVTLFSDLVGGGAAYPAPEYLLVVAKAFVWGGLKHEARLQRQRR